MFENSYTYIYTRTQPFGNLTRIPVNQFGTYCIHRTQHIEYTHFVTLLAICMQNPWLKFNYNPSLSVICANALNVCLCVSCDVVITSVNANTVHRKKREFQKKKRCAIYSFRFIFFFFSMLNTMFTKLNQFVFLFFSLLISVDFAASLISFSTVCLWWFLVGTRPIGLQTTRQMIATASQLYTFIWKMVVPNKIATRKKQEFALQALWAQSLSQV